MKALRGPWCWPRDAEERAALAGELEIRSVDIVSPQTALAVSVLGDLESATLWELSIQTEGGTPLGRSALAAWADAGACLCQSVALLWRSVRQVQLAGPPTATKLRTLLFSASSTPPAETHLEGESYGTVFALMQAAELLGLAIPSDVACTGAVSADGTIRGVMGVREKSLAIALGAPRVTRLFVAREDVAAAEEALAPCQDAGHLSVVGVATVGALLDEVWGEQVREGLIKMGGSSLARTEIVDNLFHLCVEKGWSAISHFPPVVSAIEVMESEWAELGQWDRERLSIAKAIARRHIDNSGHITLPTPNQMSRLVAPQRVSFAAQVVQQCADTGKGQTVELRCLVDAHLVRGADAFVEHLELLGAWARLEAVRGEATVALEHAIEAALGLIARSRPADASHSLSLWFRLASVLGDQEALESAEGVFQRLQALGVGSVWLNAERAVAMARVQRWEIAHDALAEILQEVTLPHDYLRAMSYRWLIREASVQGNASCLLSRLQDLAKRERGADVSWRHNFRIAEAMVALDDEEESLGVMSKERALEVMQECDSGLVASLLRDCSDPVAKLRAHYPYA